MSAGCDVVSHLYPGLHFDDDRFVHVFIKGKFDRREKKIPEQVVFEGVHISPPPPLSHTHTLVQCSRMLVTHFSRTHFVLKPINYFGH